MIRLVFEKSGLGPRVFLDDQEIPEVVSVELLPLRRCLVKHHAIPVRLVDGIVETELTSGEYEVAVE